MVLGRGQGQGAFAVAEAEEGGFLAHQAFFNNHQVARVAKGALAHDFIHGMQGFVFGLGHNDALARGQAVGLDHQGGAHAPDVFAGRSRIVEYGALGRGHLGAAHDLLGKGLATLQTRAVGVGPETGNARRAHAVGDAQGQGQFRPRHHQVDVLGLGQGYQAVQIVHGYGHIARAVARGAAVARRGQHDADLRALQKFPDQGVFPPAGTYYQNAHGTFLLPVKKQGRPGIVGPPRNLPA